MKKGQGLSLNTIIVAAIVLIVLVVLIMVFTGRMQIFNIGLGNATNPVCKNSEGRDCQLDCPMHRVVVGDYSDCVGDERCCRPE